MSDDGECSGGHLGGEPGGRRVLPAGLADMPAGPRLAVLVASVDRRVCNGYELEELIKARRRLVCWLDADCLSDVNELAHANSGMPDEPAQRNAGLDSMTQAVLEPLLGWTGHHAGWYLALATTLPRLPRVQEALAVGQLELNDVRTIVDRISDAKPGLWGVIEDAIFPKVLELRGGLQRHKGAKTRCEPKTTCGPRARTSGRRPIPSSLKLRPVGASTGTAPFTGTSITTCTTAGVSVATAPRHRSPAAQCAARPRSTGSRFTTPPPTMPPPTTTATQPRVPPRHHKAKTERDWKLQQNAPGEHTLTDPYGRHYRSTAPTLTDPVTPAEDDLPPF